jgi:pathogenesis-related protein 1
MNPLRPVTDLLLVLGLIAGAVACSSDGASNGSAGEPADLVGITAAHNSLRAEVGVAGLKWNGQLAELAAKFIADCQFQHSTGGERSNVAGFVYIGENLYMSSGKPTGQQVSDAWAGEKNNYDPASGQCSGGECGHYTQQVWRTTTDLGCAIKQCSTGSIVSCEYGPGGNSGGKAY